MNFAKALKYYAVYIAISLAGERIIHLVPTIFECSFNFSIIGMMKDPVLPLPVLAIAIMLKP